MMKGSSVLLLDEPTSGLDDFNTDIIKKLVLKESADKICIVSTHDARLLEIADEIIDFNQPVSL
jgi:ABC-type lipoprotein export system ATPase subunit